MNLPRLALACALLGLAGCATYPVQVLASRYAAPTATQRTYMLNFDAAGDAGKSPQFEPALQCLRSALAQRGFSEVHARDDASVVIGFTFAATAAGYQVSHSTRSADVTKSIGPVPSNGRRVEPPPPSREVFVVRQTEPRYHVSMHIEARDAKTDREVWRVDTTANIGPHDRNAILPCLVAAAKPFIDPPESTTRDVAIGQASAEVRALRNGS